MKLEIKEEVARILDKLVSDDMIDDDTFHFIVDDVSNYIAEKYKKK